MVSAVELQVIKKEPKYIEVLEFREGELKADK